MFSRKRLLVSLTGFLLAFIAVGFNGQKVTNGPVTLRIGNIPIVTNRNTSQTFTVSVSNAGPAALAVNLEMAGLADEARAVGETSRQIEVPSGAWQQTTFQFTMGDGSLSVLSLRISA